MHHTLALLHDSLFGSQRSVLTGQIIRSVKIVSQSKEWILCTFFQDRSHRIWLLNKSTEMWAASSSSDEWEFDFFAKESENWYSSRVIIDPEEEVLQQLEKYHMEVVFTNNQPYFNIVEV